MQFSTTCLLALAATVHVALSAAVDTSLVDASLADKKCPNQDLDPKGIICKTSSDCKDPCFPVCTCGSVIIGTVVGQKPNYVYNCAKSAKDDGC